VRVHFVTGVAETRAGALALIEKYSDRHAADRVFELSWTHSQVLLRRLDVSEADTARYERLASHILYASPQLRAPRSVIARNQARPVGAVGPRHLRRPADRPGPHRRSPANLDLVRQLVKAHAFWRIKRPGRRPRDLERGPVGLPRGPAGGDPRGDRRALGAEASLLDRPAASSSAAASSSPRRTACSCRPSPA
jgi:hypothetical protein